MSILGPAMDPDGARITTGYYRLDGTLIRRLPLPRGMSLGAGAVSADGKHLLFEGSSADGALDGIYVGDANGTHLVRLTRHHDLVIDFSADGRQASYFAADPTFPAIGDQREGSIWRVNLDGTGRERVTGPDLPVEQIGSLIARVSGVRGQLVFTSAGAIWTVREDGSDATRLWASSDGDLAINPTWSPDGTMILFGLDPAGSLATVDVAPPNVLDVIRADGTGLTSVVTTRDWKREPEWIDP
jgi:Tol biopolymer transport system component